MSKSSFLLTLSFCLLLMISTSVHLQLQAAPDASLVTKLPGFNGTFPSKHYSGYLTIGGEAGAKNLFYYFVLSERNPSTDAVVLWLNGGPGCSSFDGFVYEHGPFSFEAAKEKGGLPTLHLNPHSWSKVSNIIYLDSPVGVGFSYPIAGSTGDKQTAKDTHEFLLKWFEKFPEFILNQFYLTGESYAGIYIPTLAVEVDKGIRNGIKPKINLKGYMIGNGICDNTYDGNALVPFAHGMGLISNIMHDEARQACKGTYFNNSDRNCLRALTNIDKALVDLNIYNILEPCYHGNAEPENSRLPESFKQLGKSDDNRSLPVRKRMFGRAWPYHAPVNDGILTLWPQLLASGVSVPCTNDIVASIWLNNDEVRKAIHASPMSGKWELCTGYFVYYHDAGSMIEYHKNLTTSGYRALIYSGDHDMCVPVTGTEAWTESLGFPVVEEWRPWISKGQVAGYLRGYSNLTFLTIKGAGHTVPEYKPKEAFDFYSHWLQGKKI